VTGEDTTTTTTTATAERPSDRSDVRETVRDARGALGEKADDLRETARSTLHGARAAVEQRSESAKATAADEMARTAEGLEAAAREMGDAPLQQDLLHEAAEGLKQLSRAVQGKSIGTIVEDLSDFGRRNPLAYLGGAALAGFALARFARASAPDDAFAEPRPIAGPDEARDPSRGSATTPGSFGGANNA
jgi:ElaB/YqjD/DUF883 family membrane-anchored ribosome-binding protein